MWSNSWNEISRRPRCRNRPDCLRAHPAEARVYEALKVSLTPRSSGDAHAYTDGKTAFIREIDRRAAAWRRDSPPTTPFHHSAL